MSDLERRIRALEDVEAIKRLKYRYWRHLDLKQWDELAACFAADARSTSTSRSPTTRLARPRAFTKRIAMGRGAYVIASRRIKLGGGGGID